MTVKIDGTTGIDTAQLRAPDGDPVAVTIDNAGVVSFPAMPQVLGPSGAGSTAQGSITLPGGLVIKWGTVAGTTDGNGLMASVVYTAPFSNSAVVMVSNGDAEAATPGGIAGVFQPALNGFTPRMMSAATVPVVSQGVRLNWIAIGY